jgi:hypothetical protein
MSKHSAANLNASLLIAAARQSVLVVRVGHRSLACVA